MKNVYDLNLAELTEYLSLKGEPKFRAKQIYDNFVSGKSISEMSNVSLKLKDELKKDFYDAPAKIIERHVSKDGTVKYLFSLADGNVVEGVVMNYKYGKTQCLSTQVGCRMGCKFCASTLNGLVCRNFSVFNCNFYRTIGFVGVQTIKKFTFTKIVFKRRIISRGVLRRNVNSEFRKSRSVVNTEIARTYYS